MNDLEQNRQLPTIYVNSNAALAECVSALEQEPAFAFDLEFDRDHFSYGFDLCLMQLASPSCCWLIDPKAGIDITPIFPVLENDRILKVVHSSGEDLRLMHSLQCFPKNLADTELYARLLDYERPSLGAMLQELFGITLDKSMQKINWALRPLGPQQIEYAANDVRYLLPLLARLEQDAAAKNVLSFVAEENQLLSTTIYDMGPKDNFLKKNDLIYLSPYDQHILNGMFIYRDNVAQLYNKPVHYIINESVLRSLVFDGIPEYEWHQIHGVHPSQKNAAGRKAVFGRLHELRSEAKALKLSTKRGQPEVPGNGFQAEKARNEKIKAAIFTPLQQDIAAKYGTNAMRFIFSTKSIDSIIQGQMRVSELKTPYRRQLVRETAQRLGIDISPYE